MQTTMLMPQMKIKILKKRKTMMKAAIHRPVVMVAAMMATMATTCQTDMSSMEMRMVCIL